MQPLGRRQGWSSQAAEDQASEHEQMGTTVVSYWLRISSLSGADRELVFRSITALVGFIQTGVRIRAIGVQSSD